jgi:hypothetical protein
MVPTVSNHPSPEFRGLIAGVGITGLILYPLLGIGPLIVMLVGLWLVSPLYNRESPPGEPAQEKGKPDVVRRLPRTGARRRRDR